MTTRKFLTLVEKLDTKLDKMTVQNNETNKKVRDIGASFEAKMEEHKEKKKIQGIEDRFSTDNLDKLMEVARTVIPISVKNQQEIAKLNEENYTRDTEMNEINETMRSCTRNSMI